MALKSQLLIRQRKTKKKKKINMIIKMNDAEHYLALWSGLSAPWRPGQRSEPGRTPGPGASDGTWQLALPVVGRCLRTGWGQRLKGGEWEEEQGL